MKVGPSICYHGACRVGPCDVGWELDFFYFFASYEKKLLDTNPVPLPVSDAESGEFRYFVA